MRKKDKTKMNRVKFLITGSYNSGKTTVMESLIGNIVKVEYNGTTVALDYGKLKVNSKEVHLFGTPGQERFKFMRDILSKGIDGGVLVVDSTLPITKHDQEIIREFRSAKIPFVVFANKRDLPDALPLQEFDVGVPVIPTIAKSGENLHKGIEILLEMRIRGGFRN
ncbi:MAG: ATP/GTP-binding protein [Candidatus Hydrothermarchaeota archaeon]